VSPVSDEFLLTTAQIAATLIGLLLVGTLFYAETGLRHLASQSPAAPPYLRAGIRWVLLVYSMVLGISLALIAFEPAWVAIIFVGFAVAIVAGLVAHTRRTVELSRARPGWLPPGAAVLPWPPTAVALGLPWILGGLTPPPDAYVVTLLLAGAMAFLSTASIVLLTIELPTDVPDAERVNDQAPARR
jgi:hypothetical protein